MSYDIFLNCIYKDVTTNVRLKIIQFKTVEKNIIYHTFIVKMNSVEFVLKSLIYFLPNV